MSGLKLSLPVHLEIHDVVYVLNFVVYKLLFYATLGSGNDLNHLMLVPFDGFWKVYNKSLVSNEVHESFAMSEINA